MAIKLTTTKDQTSFIKCLVYGDSGIGKTTLAKTCPKPLIISSEKKMMSLKDEKIPVVLIEDHKDLAEVLQKIKTDKKFTNFETIVLDSVSDIAETILQYFLKNPEKGEGKDQRQAYMSLGSELNPLLKEIRDLPDKHVYAIAKVRRMNNDHTGIDTWMPSAPGQQLGPNLPYLFDYVFAMRKGVTKSGKEYRYLQTDSDVQWIAKGTKELNAIEEPHLGKLFNKILNNNKEES